MDEVMMEMSMTEEWILSKDMERLMLLSTDMLGVICNSFIQDLETLVSKFGNSFQ
jgi:hypothetical protein